MHIRLESASGSPVYQQIVDQVKRMAAEGVLRTGDRLPTVRELASQLIVNPNTVAHAYQSLERDKIIETRRGLGSFICEPDSQLSHTARLRQVSVLLDRALVEAHHLNVTADEVRKLLEDRLSSLYPREDTKI
jgi:GntR family transcriptional regulator